MRKPVQGACLLTVLACAAYGQTFEVASVKVSQLFRQGGEGSRRSKIDTTPGSLTMYNVGLPEVIRWAYNVTPFQIGPGLTDGDRYDILAKAAGPATVDEMRPMLQKLLAERFKLAVHRETKEMSAYALVEAKGGHKMKQSEAGDGPGIVPTEGPSRIALDAHKASLDQLGLFLSGPLRTPVVDMTGLKGKFDFVLDITAYIPQEKDRQPGEPPPDPVSVLQTVLPKQLGLRLDARKLPIEMVMIDHVEKTPVEN
jgi:uncharacterized protein (TIGR03435 family)